MSTFQVMPARGPLAGSVAVPGDKSIGHRAVMLAGLCDGEVRVRGLSGGGDNRSTVAALRALGVAMVDEGGVLRVQGAGLRGLRAATAPLDCGNSGTTLRIMTGLLAAQPFASELTGDEYLRRRPMRRVVEPLAAMGAAVAGATGARPGEVYPPLRIAPAAALRGAAVELAIASAQVKSAVLLAALYAEGASRVREPGPSRDHTERMLGYLGAPLTVAADGAVIVDPAAWPGGGARRLVARDIDVPGDPSSAAFLVAAALLAGAGEVRVRGVCVNPTRTGFLDALAAMGAEVAREPDAGSGPEPTADLVVRAPAGGATLRGSEVGGDLTVRAIDELPVLAVVAAWADGVTHFRDAAELRVKESDRIASTTAMLRALGVEVEERPDGFTVAGRNRRPFTAATIDSAGDHRIAMAAAVAGLAAAGPCRVMDVANVATSFPAFTSALRTLGAEIG